MAVPMKGTGERMSLKSPSIITCCSSGLLGLLDKKNPSKRGENLPKNKNLVSWKVISKFCCLSPLSLILSFVFFFSLSVPAVSLNKLV